MSSIKKIVFSFLMTMAFLSTAFAQPRYMTVYPCPPVKVPVPGIEMFAHKPNRYKHKILRQNTKKTGILYHCPLLKELHYKKGTFSSATYYNGLRMNWYTDQNFSEKKVQIPSFDNTGMLNNCIGGACAIYCVYHTNSSNKVLFLEVLHHAYRVVKAAKGPWKDNICSAKEPETCTFYVIANTFKWYISKHKQASQYVMNR